MLRRFFEGIFPSPCCTIPQIPPIKATHRIAEDNRFRFKAVALYIRLHGFTSFAEKYHRPEAEERNVSLENIGLIADGFGVTPSELLDFSSIAPPDAGSWQGQTEV